MSLIQLTYTDAPTCKKIYYYDYTILSDTQKKDNSRVRCTGEALGNEVFESGLATNSINGDWKDYCSTLCTSRIGCLSFSKIFVEPLKYKCHLYTCSPLTNNAEFIVDGSNNHVGNRYAWFDIDECVFTPFPTRKPTPNPTLPPSTISSPTSGSSPTIGSSPTSVSSPTIGSSPTTVSTPTTVSSQDSIFIIVAVIVGVLIGLGTIYVIRVFRKSKKSTGKTRFRQGRRI